MGGPDFDLEASGGNGIFGCGDRTPKIAAEALGHLQRPKSAKRKAGNPRRKRPVSVVLETRGLQSSNQSPPPSQERNFSMQRRRVEIRLFCLQRLTRRRGRTRKARYSRDKCTDHRRSSIPEDCVVVCAVRYKPVSDCNSLIMAVLQGIFREIRAFAQNGS